MRAAVFHENGGPEVLRLEEVPTPEPGPGEVRIRVRAAAMNHLDLWVRRGLPNLQTTFPHVGGSDMAGEVDAVGPGVEGIELGTRVAVDPSLDYGWYDGEPSGAHIRPLRFRILGEHTWGGFAQYAVVPAANLLEVPEGVPWQVAAAAGLTGVTAWRGLVTRGGVRAGDRVLITGASGGVGTIAVQIAVLAGATVYAVTSGRDNVARVRDLGAHIVYDRIDEDFSKDLWKDTGRRGVNIVLDSVGEAMWEANLRALTVGGTLVTYGATTGHAGATDIRQVFWKQLSVVGTTMGTPAEYREVMHQVFKGRIAPVVHEALPLEEAARAHEMLESGDVFGKLVLLP